MPLSLETLRSIGHDVAHGIKRLLEALQFADDPVATEHFALLSAIEQLRRGITTDQLGHSYLARLLQADDSARKAAMEETGCTQTDLDNWHRQYGHLPQHH